MRFRLAATLLLLAPASAQAAWTGQDLSGPHTFVDDPALIVSGSGRALAAWRFQDGIGDAGRGGHAAAARDGGAFGPERSLTRPAASARPGSTVAGLGAYGRGRALVALLVPGPDPRDTPGRLAVRFGATDGTFGRLRTIRRARGHRIGGASLAVDARGDAALAWWEDRGVRTDRVYVALRRRGHGFGAPRRLATGRIRGVAAAIGARGDALVAWDARGVLRTRFRPRSRRGFLATDTIRSKPAYSAELAPVVTPSGRAVLAWSAQFASEGGDRGPQYFQTAARPASARRFARARLLETVPAAATDGLGRPIDAVADSTGAVAVAWRGAAGTRAIRGRGAPQTVSAPGTPAILSDLAAGPGGRLVAVWDGGVEDPASVVRAAIAGGPGAAFGPPEDVSPAGQAARFGHAAFLGETPAVVLSNRPGGTDTYAQAYVR